MVTTQLPSMGSGRDTFSLGTTPSGHHIPNNEQLKRKDDGKATFMTGWEAPFSAGGQADKGPGRIRMERGPRQPEGSEGPGSTLNADTEQ